MNLRDSSLSAAGPLPTDARREPPYGRIALVCMPWGSIEIPSIAISLLKAYVHAAGFVPELHYLNLRFAQRIGGKFYEKIARAGFVHTEWFFSQLLFGPAGTGELENSWSQIKDDPGARSLTSNFQHLLEMTDEECERLAGEQAPAFIDDCVNGIDWSGYVAIGFTATFAQSLATLLVSKRIKALHPHVKIILGGANFDAEMGVEIMRACDWVDFVVHGEAENSFPALLREFAEGNFDAQLPGISVRRGGEVLRSDQTPGAVVDMNDVAAPDYSDYVAELDRSGLRKDVNLSLSFESSRGCWWGAKHHCTFCGLNGSTMSFRKKDAEKVHAEILDLADKYRVLKLFATDNILSNDYFTQLLPKLAEQRFDIELFYEVKANLRREQLKLMADAGVVTIQPGIESFNSRLLQLMRKGITAIQNIQLLKWCWELGICPNYNILYSFPHETPDDYKDLPDLFRKLSHLRPPGSITQVVVERFSPYHFDSQTLGVQYWPWSVYDYIYPKSRVDISKVAYFFHSRWDGKSANPLEYIAPAQAAWEEWRDLHAKNEVHFQYERGPKRVRIFDNRPRAPKAQRARGFELNEQMSAIYLFCDENRTFRSIVEMMRARFDPGMGEARVRRWLDQLVEQWLMFQEGERYLSLAVRRAREMHPR